MCCPHLSDQIIPVPHIPFYSLTPLTALLGEWPENKARIRAQNETCKHGLFWRWTHTECSEALPFCHQNHRTRIKESLNQMKCDTGKLTSVVADAMSSTAVYKCGWRGLRSSLANCTSFWVWGPVRSPAA